MTNDLLLLKYELKPSEHLKVDMPDAMLKDMDFPDMLRYFIDFNLIQVLQGIRIYNNSHLCLSVTFSRKMIEQESNLIDQTFIRYNSDDDDNDLDFLEEDDRHWQDFHRSIVDPIVKELRAYERQEFSYREIEI